MRLRLRLRSVGVTPEGLRVAVRRAASSRYAPVAYPLLLALIVAIVMLASVPAARRTAPITPELRLASLMSWNGAITPKPFDGAIPLPKPATSEYRTIQTTPYIVRPGDTIIGISQQYGVSDESIIAFNGVDDARLIQPGNVLEIPNMNGILYRVKEDETLNDIAKRYQLPAAELMATNRLESATIEPGQQLFIPGAHMNRYAYRIALGTLFIWPAQGVITSPYGMRRDPFTGVVDFHNGIDIANYFGAPIAASTDGQVIAIGSDRIYGNFVTIDDGGGFRTLYGHLYRILVRQWQYVRSGQEIALMGDSGYSTGPHLHFSIFKAYAPVNPLVYLP